MNDRWSYEFTRPAERELRRLSHNDQERIVRAVRRMVDTPFTGDITKLSGHENEWRLRVGPWRVRFQFDHERRMVVVHSVRRRPDAYRN